MKKTRRIEVIRVSRRLTLVEYDDAFADSAAPAVLPVINISHEEQGGEAPAVDEVDVQTSDLDCVYEATSVHAKFKLGNLLRLLRRRSQVSGTGKTNLLTDTKRKRS